MEKTMKAVVEQTAGLLEFRSEVSEKLGQIIKRKEKSEPDIEIISWRTGKAKTGNREIKK